MKKLRAYQNVPYPLGTPEWESFKNYAVAYYEEATFLVAELLVDMREECTKRKIGLTAPFVDAVVRNLLNVVIAPLVFLWEQWQLMSLDDKMKYATPKYETQLGRVKRRK